MKFALNIRVENAILFREAPMDSYDLGILRILQQDNTTPQRLIGEAVNLSAPAVQRRIRRLEAEGVITANVAVLAPEKLGLPLTIFVLIELVSEIPAEIDAVKQRLLDAPEVLQCHYVAGETDFIVQVAAESMAAYEDFTRRVLFQGSNVRKFRTLVSMSAVKTSGPLAF